MTLHERLRRMVDAVPDEGHVTLPVAVLRQWLERDGDPGRGVAAVSASATGIDPGLTIAQVANLVNRQPSTVRGWVSEGRFAGAFMIGREWRIPRRDLERFLAPVTKEEDAAPSPDQDLTGRGDLGAWRKERAT